METDYSALASRIAASSDVLGCMILSSEGVVLGTFPVGDETLLKPAWLKFAALGDASSGFVRFSDAQLWAYVKAGPYAAFALASVDARAGVVLDSLEQALLLAADSRDLREAARPFERVDLVGEQRREDPAPVASTPAPARAAVATPATPVAPPAPADPVAAAPDPQPEKPQEELPTLDGEEVDRVALTREFSALLQDEWRNVEDSF